VIGYKNRLRLPASDSQSLKNLHHNPWWILRDIAPTVLKRRKLWFSAARIWNTHRSQNLLLILIPCHLNHNRSWSRRQTQ